jgi:competence protein ComEA
MATAPGDDGEEAWWSDHTRVAALRREEQAVPAPVLAAPEPPAPEPPALPRPGRHAARRRWRPTLPALALPGITPAHVAVVAVLVAVGLAVTTWWVARDQPEPLPPVSAEPVAPLVAGVSPSAGDPSSAASPGTGGSVTVDVAGKVRRPGIVVLDQGARVTDALEAAGGAKRGVDLTPINLARVLVDGEQIVVGGPPGSAGAGSAAGGAAAAGPAGALVNLNTAAQAELETLPGVGPVTAMAIIAWRDRSGGFTSIDELLEVDGIGEKTLASLAPLVTV